MANEATAPKLIEFRKSHPIDFTLLDKDNQAVMYISEDQTEGELQLTIANTSTQTIALKDAPVKPTTGPNHHFALQFRAGTLSQQTLTLLSTNFAKFVQPKDWQVAQLTQKPVGNTPVTLYLRYTGASKDLTQTTPQSLKLTGFTAAPGSGSRGTQVELIPNSAQVVFSSDNNGVTGSRTQYLHVTNHSGKKNIPLHVGFFRGNQVLPGKTKDLLTLRITNTLRVKKDTNESGKIIFRGENAAKEPQSVLVLSYDRGDSEWDLGKSIVSVSAVNSKKGVAVAGVPDKNLPESVMTFKNDVVLEYGESIDVEIRGIDVSPKPGHAHLYLHYNNIPGYWDGQFVCTVEKGSLIEKDGRVGIGTDDLKDTTLTVAGKTAVAGELTANTLTITTDAGSPAINVTGQTMMDFGPNGGLLFRGNNNANPAIMTQKAKVLTICAENGGNIQELVLNATTIKAVETLVVKDLVVQNQANGIRPVKFQALTFYFLRSEAPKNGRLEGHIVDGGGGIVHELVFPHPVKQVEAFLSSYHLEFVKSATSSDRKERPLSLIGVGVDAVIDPGNPNKVNVKAWATLSDDQKTEKDNFEGSAKIIVLTSFSYAVY